MAGMGARATELLELGFAAYGSVEQVGAGTVTFTAPRHGIAIKFLADTVIASQVDYGTSNMDLAALGTISAGEVLYGRWTTIVVTSGTIVVYKG